MKQKNGITLIALIITVIILLILAGVAISTIAGENGLLSKTKESAETYNKQAAMEQINLKISVIAMDKYGEGKYGDLTLQEIADGLAKDEGIEYVQGGATASLDVTGYNSILTKLKEYKYVFEIKSIKDIKIIGEEGKIALKLTDIKTEVTETKIKLKVNGINIDGATFKYYYKTGTGEYQEVAGEVTRNTEITGLNANTEYTVKVEATGEKGTDEKEITVRTQEDKDAPTITIGNFSKSSAETGEKVTVNVTITDISGVNFEGCTYTYKKEDGTTGTVTQSRNGDVVTLTLTATTVGTYKLYVNAKDTLENETQEAVPSSGEILVVLPKTTASTVSSNLTSYVGHFVESYGKTETEDPLGLGSQQWWIFGTTVRNGKRCLILKDATGYDRYDGRGITATDTPTYSWGNEVSAVVRVLASGWILSKEDFFSSFGHGNKDNGASSLYGYINLLPTNKYLDVHAFVDPQSYGAKVVVCSGSYYSTGYGTQQSDSMSPGPWTYRPYIIMDSNVIVTGTKKNIDGTDAKDSIKGKTIYTLKYDE